MNNIDNYISKLPMPAFLAEEFHDIAPPVDYSLIPPWLIFLGVFVSLSIIGLVAWLIIKTLLQYSGFRRSSTLCDGPV